MQNKIFKPMMIALAVGTLAMASCSKEDPLDNGNNGSSVNDSTNVWTDSTNNGGGSTPIDSTGNGGVPSDSTGNGGVVIDSTGNGGFPTDSTGNGGNPPIDSTWTPADSLHFQGSH